MRKMLLAIICLTFALPVTAQNSLFEKQKATLRGLTGVYVLVEKINDSVKDYGITENQIRTDVELRLRKAGIRVLSQSESFNTPGEPYLYIKIGIVNIQTSGDNFRFGYAYDITVSLEQDVLLERKIMADKNTPVQIPISAATWERGTLGVLPKADVRSIRDDVNDYIDQFINDFLAVNPR